MDIYDAYAYLTLIEKSERKRSHELPRGRQEDNNKEGMAKWAGL
jgi:hypothetical protein